MIYQHATAEADRVIADAVSAQVEAEQEKARKARKKALKKPRPDPDGKTSGPRDSAA